MYFRLADDVTFGQAKTTQVGRELKMTYDGAAPDRGRSLLSPFALLLLRGLRCTTFNEDLMVFREIQEVLIFSF